MRRTRILAAGIIATTMALWGAVACGDDTEQVAVTEYEDCDTGDQDRKEDDCGYWQKGTEYRTGGQPDLTWVWIWFAWVHLGQPSRPPAGWHPPKGVPAPPTRTVYRTQPKNRPCALGPAPAPPRPPAPAVRAPAPPRAPAGNAPKPAQPKRPAQKGGC